MPQDTLQITAREAQLDWPAGSTLQLFIANMYIGMVSLYITLADMGSLREVKADYDAAKVILKERQEQKRNE